MDSIVREVVSRAAEEPRVPEAPTQKVGMGTEDAELERILASLRTNIKIIGIGGGGSNTIDRLVEAGIVGAELYAANTDAQHLLTIRSPHKLLLGRRATRGLGAGALPQVGEEAAREAADELRSVLHGADMVFLTCGLGGGTGTGGAPVVARLLRELGHDGRPHDCDLHVPVPGRGRDPRGERGVRPREAPELGGHRRRDPE